MIREIAKESKIELLKKSNIFVLAFFTLRWFIITELYLVLRNVNNLLIYKYKSWLSLLLVFRYFWGVLSENNLVLVFILLLVFIVFWYFVLFPLANGALVHIVQKWWNIGRNLGRGLTDFFKMFELNALYTSFGIITYCVTLLRVYTLDIVNNIFIEGVFVLWGIFVVIALLFWPYAKIFVIVEWASVYAGIRKSITFAIEHWKTTFKAVLYQQILTVYFYIRVGVFFLIPTLLMYGLIYFNLLKHAIVPTILWVLWIIGLLMFCYINAIILSYFEVYRYKIYTTLIKEDEKEEVNSEEESEKDTTTEEMIW